MKSLVKYQISLEDESATQKLATFLVKNLLEYIHSNTKQNSADIKKTVLAKNHPGLCWHLNGNLGSGKTTLVRALLKAMGYKGKVKSPTYTLCESYSINLPVKLQIYHFDLYRLTDTNQWYDLGFDEYLKFNTLCLVEWPERAQLPLPDIFISLIQNHSNDSRLAKIQAYTKLGCQLLLTPIKL